MSDKFLRLERGQAEFYQSKIRFLRLKRVRIWCQWLRYSGTRLCCASGRSVIALVSCCQLELGVDCFFAIGVGFIFLLFRSKRKNGIHLSKWNISSVFKIKVTFYSIYRKLATTKITENSAHIIPRLQNKMVTLTRNIWKIKDNCK